MDPKQADDAIDTLLYDAMRDIDTANVEHSVRASMWIATIRAAIYELLFSQAVSIAKRDPHFGAELATLYARTQELVGERLSFLNDGDEEDPNDDN